MGRIKRANLLLSPVIVTSINTVLMGPQKTRRTMKPFAIAKLEKLKKRSRLCPDARSEGSFSFVTEERRANPPFPLSLKLLLNTHKPDMDIPRSG